MKKKQTNIKYVFMFCAVAGYSKSFKDLGCNAEHKIAQNIISSRCECLCNPLGSIVVGCAFNIIKVSRKTVLPFKDVIQTLAHRSFRILEPEGVRETEYLIHDLEAFLLAGGEETGNIDVSFLKFGSVFVLYRIELVEKKDDLFRILLLMVLEDGLELPYGMYPTVAMLLEGVALQTVGHHRRSASVFDVIVHQSLFAAALDVGTCDEASDSPVSFIV